MRGLTLSALRHCYCLLLHLQDRLHHRNPHPALPHSQRASKRKTSALCHPRAPSMSASPSGGVELAAAAAVAGAPPAPLATGPHPVPDMVAFHVEDGEAAGGVTARMRHPPGPQSNTAPAPLSAPQGAGKSVPVTAYNSPKDALLACIKAGMAKSILRWWEMSLLAFNAGFFLSFGSLAALVVCSGFAAPTLITETAGTVSSIAGHAMLARLLYGLLFPIGLILIVLAGSELFTGNIMYLSLAFCSGKAEGKHVAKNLALVWLFNLGGACFCAFFLAYLTELVHVEPQRNFLLTLADKKMSLGWGNVFLRAVGCNWLVCLALWCNLCAQDVVSKIFALWLPISTFVWIGWEHSIANMFVVPLALMEGVPGHHFGHFLAWNLIPVTLGNMLGGFLFAMGQFLIYGEYAKPKVEVMMTKHIAKKQSFKAQ